MWGKDGGEIREESFSVSPLLCIREEIREGEMEEGERGVTD